MKYMLPLLLVLTTSVQAQKIHYKSVLVDTHNDCITACIEKKVSLDQDLKGINHSDLKRFKEGGLDYQLFSIWCDGEKLNPYAWAMREMDTLDAVAARNPDKIVVAKDWKTIKKTLRQGKIVAQIRKFIAIQIYNRHHTYYESVLARAKSGRFCGGFF